MTKRALNLSARLNNLKSDKSKEAELESSIKELANWDEDAPIIGKMIIVAKILAKKCELFNGYR